MEIQNLNSDIKVFTISASSFPNGVNTDMVYIVTINE
jgi:hypothetical protein